MASEAVNEILAEDKIIELWSDFPCLYAVSSADFKNRDKRQQALEYLAENVDHSVLWVKNKLRYLRNKYTKAKKPGKSGSAANNLTKRNQWLVDKMQFLAPYVAVRNTVSNLDFSPPATPVTESEIGDDMDDLDPEESQDSEPGDITNLKQDPVKQPQRKTKSTKRKREEEEFDIIKGLANSLQNKQEKPKTDELDNFGQYIVLSLRKLDTTTRLMAENKIQNILFQAQIGALGQNQNIPTTHQMMSPQHPMMSPQHHMMSPQQLHYMMPPHPQMITPPQQHINPPQQQQHMTSLHHPQASQQMLSTQQQNDVDETDDSNLFSL